MPSMLSLLVVGVLGVFLFLLFFSPFETEDSAQMPDNERDCLIQYGMSCEQYTAEQLKIRPNP